MKIIHNQPKEPIPMGAGNFKESIFRRTFRWTMEIFTIEDDGAVTSLVPASSLSAVNFDYSNRVISFKAYDIILGNENVSALVWALNMHRNSSQECAVKFCTFDGCGNCLDTSYFSGLTLLEHTSNFSYASNEVSEQNIKISYNSMSFLLKDKIIIEDKEDIKYKIAFFDGDDKVHEEFVSYFNKPSVDIKELALPRLNAEMFIPGKANWGDVTIYKKGRMANRLTDCLYCGKILKIELSLYRGNEIEESFVLDEAFVQQINNSDNYCNFKIRFSKCQYNPKDLQWKKN